MLDFLVFPCTVVPMLFRDFKLRGQGGRKFSAIPSFNDRFKSLEVMADVEKPSLSKCRSTPEEITIRAPDFMEYVKSVLFSCNYYF